MKQNRQKKSALICCAEETLNHQMTLTPLDCRKRDFFITGDRRCWLLWGLQQILFNFSNITYRLCVTINKAWAIHHINYINIYWQFFHIRGVEIQLSNRVFPHRSHNPARCWGLFPLWNIWHFTELPPSFSIVYDISYFYVTSTVLKDPPLFWSQRAKLTILYLKYMTKESVWDNLLIFHIF